MYLGETISEEETTTTQTIDRQMWFIAGQSCRRWWLSDTHTRGRPNDVVFLLRTYYSFFFHLPANLPTAKDNAIKERAATGALSEGTICVSARRRNEITRQRHSAQYAARGAKYHFYPYVMIILRFRSDAVGWCFFIFSYVSFFFHSGCPPPAPGKGLVTNWNSRNGDPASADHDFFIVCLLRRRRRLRSGLQLFVFSSLSHFHCTSRRWKNTSYDNTTLYVQMYDFRSHYNTYYNLYIISSQRLELFFEALGTE